MKRNYILIPIGGGGGGKQIELSPLTVTENGVYTAGEDKGYSEVSVSVADIPAVTEPLNVTENGTYTPSSGVDGFSEVSVNVPDIPAVTEPLNITENGTYTPSSGVDGFSEVSVNVPDIPAVTEPLNVTENGTYTPSSGVDGFSEVSVNVPTTDVQNLTISQNGTYSAPEGVSYGNIEVNVPAVDVSVVSSVISANPVSFTALDVVVRIGSNRPMTSYGVDYSTDNFQNYQSVTNSGTYFGEKTITVTGLQSGTTYQVRSFVVVDGVRYDQEPFNTTATASIPVYPESVPAKATMMTTTDLSSSKTVTMGYGSTAMPDENFYVDWGDGSEIQIYAANTSIFVNHTYSETGNKTIYCWSDSTTDTEYGKMPCFKGYEYNDSWKQIKTIDTPLQKIYGGSTHYTANGSVNNGMFIQAKQLYFVCSDLFVNYCDPTQPLASNCYLNMFYNCTSLTTAPELPATRLAYECYRNMFSSCTSLTTAPVLPATTLTYYSYFGMFQNCRNLQSVTTYVTSWDTNNTYNWLNGAGTNAENPTLYCPANSTIKNYTSNGSGIPTGWTQVDLPTE